VRVVPARQEEQLRNEAQSNTERTHAPADHSIGRLAGKNKSNRQTASASLRRHHEQVREAVRRAVDNRGIRDMERGEDIHIPKKDINEPVFGHGQGGKREMVHPGNREVRHRRQIERPKGGSGQAAARARRPIRVKARTTSSFT